MGDEGWGWGLVLLNTANNMYPKHEDNHVFGGAFVSSIYSYARRELLQAIQVSVVMSLAVRVTSVARY